MKIEFNLEPHEADFVERILGLLSLHGGSVQVPGLGLFWLGRRPERVLRDLRTKQLRVVPATIELRFRAHAAARRRVRALRPSEVRGAP